MFVGEGGLLYPEMEDVLVLYATIFDCTEQEAADRIRYPTAWKSRLRVP